ncbi:MAG TPA: DUF885 family protein, partial [Gemmatimonadaceae bacterium]|nr:DUF885 family protein [Gemmatimonadaceae bacterium]
MLRARTLAVLGAAALVTGCNAGGDRRRANPGDAVTAAGDGATPPYGSSRKASRDFAALVDEYLDGWAGFYPAIAAGNGLHQHDDQLEDFSAANIARQLSWFREMKARLYGISTDSLTADERVDHRILGGVIDGWVLDLDVARSWQRNPMIYASAIADGVHNLMTMESAPPEERMRRVTGKLRQVPALLAA